MNDMSQVIIPKSDQLNAEDFLAGPRSYQIDHVDIRPGTEQPVTIQLAGEQRAWKPCKSMSRVLVSAWGPDANKYVGRSVTLYLDPKVKWGGLEVGGIRISHLSHIDRDMVMALTATKGKRAPFMVKPLVQSDPKPKPQSASEWAKALIASIEAASSGPAASGLLQIPETADKLEILQNGNEAQQRLAQTIKDAEQAKYPADGEVEA